MTVIHAVSDVSKCMSVVGAVLGLVTSISAADVKFPNADGSNDISSDAAWGGSKPGVSDTAIFTGTNCTHTAKADVEFGLMKVMSPDPSWSWKHRTLTFDMRPEVSGATADAPRTIRVKGLDSGSYGMDLLVRGGVWDFKNGEAANNMPTMSGGWTVENSITFSDGAVIQNVKCAYQMINANTRSHFRLTGGSTFKSTTALWPFDTGYTNTFEVLDGSYCKIMGLQFGRGGSSQSARESANRIVVAGRGSRFEATGYVADAISIGYKTDTLDGAPGNVFCVTNGGSVKFNGDFVVGSTRSNTLWLDAGGSLTGSAMRVGYTSVASNNLVFVGKGSTLSINAGNRITLGCTAGADGNALVVSNGYVNVPFLYIGRSGACNNLVRVCGPDAVLNVQSLAGGGLFADGVEGSRGNALELDGGATVDWTAAPSDLFMGGHLGAVSIGNEVRLRNGSTLKANNCYVGHTNSTENVLKIDATSQLACSGGSQIVHAYPGNTIKLTVPSEGYVKKPILAATFTFDAGSVLQIDASAWTSGPKSCTVFSSWKALEIAPSVIEAANADLDGKYTLKYTLKLSKDKMMLTLHRHEGMLLIVR